MRDFRLRATPETRVLSYDDKTENDKHFSDFEIYIFLTRV